MSCPDFETLARGEAAAHAAHCAECGALLDALADVDSALDAAFGVTAAPPSLAASVRMRISAEQQRRGVSFIPEALDLVGWAALLGLVFVLAQRFVPAMNAALSHINL